MMQFLRRLLGGASQPPEDNALHLYVQCGRCGAPVHVRIDLRNDLSAEYGDDSIEGYTLIKEIMDSRCFRLMRAEVQFDRHRRELVRTLEGGEFITSEAYEHLVQQERDRKSSTGV